MTRKRTRFGTRRPSRLDPSGADGVRRWSIETISPRSSLRMRLTPERLLVLSFAGLIVLGTVGFRTLPGLYVGDPLSWLDSLFTATSAICVTGLIVVDTATYFTTAGQAYLLLLIQIGGLGILTLTTLVILVLGRRLSLHHQAVSATAADISPDVDFRRLVRDIVRFTFVLEAFGAAILFLVWLPLFGPLDAARHALFHAVSAFCNAGFSTFSDSLVGVRASTLTLLPVMVLVVLGGLGFISLEEAKLWWNRRRDGSRHRLSLHSRLVFVTTGALLLAGWIVYGLLEWGNTLAGMSAWDRILNALFMSVTARTAGFNTVDHANVAESTNFVTILLMSVGGSPGSTAGGLKTTTFAAIGLLAYSRLRGRSVTSIWGRTIPEETIQRSVGLFVVGFSTVTLAILLYAFTHLEPAVETASLEFLHYMFEAVSAFNTVGLTMGATDTLDSTGKILTIVLMYLGRVGPLAVATAISRRRPPEGRGFRYAYEDVIIG